MAESSFHHRTTTSAPPESVWAHLQNPDVWAVVAGAESTTDHAYDGDALASFTFTASIGGIGYRGRARVTEARPLHSMRLAVDTNEVKGGIEVTIADDEDRTELDVTMRISPNGLMGAMVFGIVSNAVSDSFVESVEKLAASAEP